jgi:putative aminopeptidase FrvX
MSRLLVALFTVLTVVFPATAQTINFRVHTQEEILDRLKLAAAQNEERQAALKKLFADESCAGDRLTDQAVKHEKLGNVICTLPGETPDTILVTAHYDKVKPGMGVTDNWSGASMLPSLLYGVDGAQRKHTFIFIGFTGEEDGLVGSEFYASHLTKEQRSHIRAVINMDTLGLGPTEVWTSRADPQLLKDLINVAVALHASVAGMNVDNAGSTDSESFAKYKIPRMTLHSLTQETFPILHSDKDQMSVIKPDDYYTSYKVISAFLVYLDGTLPLSSPVTAAK